MPRRLATCQMVSPSSASTSLPSRMNFTDLPAPLLIDPSPTSLRYPEVRAALAASLEGRRSRFLLPVILRGPLRGYLRVTDQFTNSRAASSAPRGKTLAHTAKDSDEVLGRHSSWDAKNIRWRWRRRRRTATAGTTWR